MCAPARETPAPKAGQVQLAVAVHRDVGRHRRMKSIAGTQGDMVLQGVGRLASSDELGAGHDSP